MDKYTVNTLFLFYYLGQDFFAKTICRNVWLTIITFLIIIAFLIYTIVKIECKRDYFAVALGLLAIGSQIFGVIIYN
jgi:hypothetical protein